MPAFSEAFAGKRVFVTGHTGFKGSWLCEWLLRLGSDVTGYSLEPPTRPALFEQLALRKRLRHLSGDVRDLAGLEKAVAAAKPDYLFHLAAQPLVRESYRIPVETFSVNVMGTVHVLESLRRLSSPCAAVIVTTDKCYENLESGRSYTEEDALGGHDPYSSSKGAAEIAVSAFRRSFFSPERLGSESVPPVAVASARAGNVIGGGDWAPDRIVPDCVRSLAAGKPIGVRNPAAVRPWQHVLEPLGGYLCLAAQMRSALDRRDGRRLHEMCSAFNFGPLQESNRTVADLVACVLNAWPGEWRDLSGGDAPHEAKLLSLSIAKAGRVLGWRPRWEFEEAVRRTIEWYRSAAAGGESSPAEMTGGQITAFGDLHPVPNAETERVAKT
ncbi:MAG TPA: CDP-glucose 4,6-dehydratase [Opitutaceae bacterium]|jgi:CDP-glucose 4,6-dehydratase